MGLFPLSSAELDHGVLSASSWLMIQAQTAGEVLSSACWCGSVCSHTQEKHILSPGSLSSLEMPCLLSEGCVLPRAGGVGGEQSLLSGYSVWWFTCSHGFPLRQ